MDTIIGHSHLQQRKSAWIALVVSFIALAIDFYLAAFHADSYGGRIVLTCVATLAVVWLFRGDRIALGITGRMTPSYHYWVRATFVIGVAFVMFYIAAVLLLERVGVDFTISSILPDQILYSVWMYCVIAPILEESLYRLVLCTSLTALAGPHTAIVVSGVVFGGVHFVSGNPGPDNFIAGYILAWAYLRSGSIMMPLLLHSLGNACAVAIQVVHWIATP